VIKKISGIKIEKNQKNANLVTELVKNKTLTKEKMVKAKEVEKKHVLIVVVLEQKVVKILVENHHMVPMVKTHQNLQNL
jgi:hypothetical protein